MYFVYNYQPPYSVSCISLSFPVKSIFTGKVKNHCINVCKMSSGRIYWTVPCVGLVASLPFDADLLDAFSDGIFYDIDELYKSLSKGGFHYVLDMDKDSFYSCFRW